MSQHVLTLSDQDIRNIQGLIHAATKREDTPVTVTCLAVDYIRMLGNAPAVQAKDAKPKLAPAPEPTQGEPPQPAEAAE